MLVRWITRLLEEHRAKRVEELDRRKRRWREATIRVIASYLGVAPETITDDTRLECAGAVLALRMMTELGIGINTSRATTVGAVLEMVDEWDFDD